MTTTQALPHWQLTSIFPGLDSPEYRQAKRELEHDLSALEAYLETHGIGGGEPTTGDVSETFEGLLTRLDALSRDFNDLNSYLTGFTATDAFDETAQAERSSLIPWQSRFTTLSKRVTAWLGRLDTGSLTQASELARNHRYLLEKAQREARYLMGDEAEALASALDGTGGAAWAKLHGDLVSRESVRKTFPGEEVREYGLAELRNLQGAAERAVRQAAFEAELELLGRHELAFAAAMNSIKGQVNELCQRRGFASALEASLLQNEITAGSLRAMQAAVEASLPVFRRYLKAKARLLGQEALAWYDLRAPLPQVEDRSFTWEESQRSVLDIFASYSPELAAFAARSFQQNWLDVPPRAGKRNGAFCMSVPGRKESRILLNFGGSLDDVFTIAHELGHAYHNEQMYRYGRTMLQKRTPMTLAETASIFLETIAVNRLLAESQGAEKLAVLEQSLLSATQVVVDIHSRFLFEQGVFEKRRERELSASELKRLMLAAQAESYGDGLQAEARHPLMWAHKGHYYSSNRSYYNYPYTFGYLFGLGLYAEYRRQPEGFESRYDELLASTGLSDAKTLAESFGIDIESAAFWQSSLAVAAEQVAQFEALAKEIEG